MYLLTFPVIQSYYILLIQIGLHPTRTCLVYNPQNSCVEYKQSLIAYLNNLATKPSPLILMGGFNIRVTLTGSATFSYQLVWPSISLQPITDYQLFYTYTGNWYHTWLNSHKLWKYH